MTLPLDTFTDDTEKDLLAHLSLGMDLWYYLSMNLSLAKVDFCQFLLLMMI
jgi:hypothetical protein